MKKINFLRLTIVLIVLYLTFFVITYAKTTQENIASSVLRLHIIGSSNSALDQNLKLMVRDKVLEGAKYVFETSNSLEDAKKIAKENIDLITEIATKTLRENNCYDSVQVKISKEAFPAKFYGDIMLPSGRYNAVKIIIGEGRGENWWCVMYPPMCNIENLTIDSGKDTLKEALSKEDYRIISSSSIPAQIRFKIVDLVNSIL